MTTERIDIVITENGSRTVKRNLEDMASAAGTSNQAIISLTTALSAQERHTLAAALGQQRLQRAYAETANATSRATVARNNEAVSLNKLVREQDKTSASIALNNNKIAESSQVSAAKVATANQRLLDVTAQGAARTNAIVTNSIVRNDAVLAKTAALQQFNAAKIVSVEQTSAAKIDSIRTISAARHGAILQQSVNREAESQARIQLAAARTAEVQQRAQLRAQQAIKDTEKSYFTFENALKGTGILTAANAVRKAADEYTELQNKLKALGVSQADLGRTTERLAEISNRSFTTLDNTATLYARLMPAVKDLGASQNDLMKFTQAASQAMTMFGTTGGTATGAMLQLSQAMTRGKVQAQEFRSLQDGMYPLLQVVARNMDGLGGSVAQLREKMLQGKLTSKEFFDAAVKGAPELELAMANITPTTGQVMTVLQNQFTVTIGKLNESLGLTRAFADAVIALAPILPQLITGIIAAGVAWATYSAAAALATVTSVGLYGALGKVTVALITATIPFAAVAAAIAAIGAALYILRNDITLSENSIATFADLATVIANDVSTLWANMFGEAAKNSKTAADEITGANRGWFLSTADFIDMTISAFVGLGSGIIAVFTGLGPAIRDILSGIGQDMFGIVNSAITKFNDVSPVKVDLLKIEDNADAGKAAAYFENIGAAAQAGFDNAAKTGVMSGWATQKMQEAEAVAKARIAALGGQSDPSAKGPGAAPPVDTKGLAKAEAEQRKFENALERLRDKYDGVYKAQSALRDGTILLDKAVAQGEMTVEQRNTMLAQMNAELADAADPLGAVNRELDEQLGLIGKSNTEQELSNQLKTINQGLIKQGKLLSDNENAALREKLALIQREKEMYESMNAIREQTSLANIKQMKEIATMGMMIKQGGQDALDAKAYYMEANKELFKGTEDYYAQNQRASLQQKRTVDKAMREGVVSERAAWVAKMRISLEAQNQMLDHANGFFGGLAQLQSSQSKKAASIGKAAAIAQATINTYQSATAAFSAMAGIPYVGPVLGAVAAAAAIAAGMANVNAIRSQALPAFAHGGTMTVGGVGGTDSQIVSLRATPGEKVRVTTPMQEDALQSQRAGNGDTFVFNMPGIKNANQGRKTASQMQRSVVTANSVGKRFR